jgi:hypothetical protein
MRHMGTPCKTIFFESPEMLCWTVFSNLVLPYEIGEVARASAPPMRETEGSCTTNSDPSVISQHRADATSPTFGRGGLKAVLEVQL